MSIEKSLNNDNHYNKGRRERKDYWVEKKGGDMEVYNINIVKREKLSTSIKKKK